MKINNLYINQFRPFREAEIKFTDGLNLIVGKNGQGKTSILEAVYLLSSSRSFRTSDYREMIKHESESATIDGTIQTEMAGKDFIEEKLRVFMSKDKKEYRVDRKKSSQASFYGHFGCISLANRDMDIVRGTPEDRRRFLDRAISISRPYYFGHYLNYRKALMQRNNLLKKAREQGKSTRNIREEIAPWNITFAEQAVELIAERDEFIRELNNGIKGHYEKLFKNVETVNIIYKSSIKKKLPGFLMV